MTITDDWIDRAAAAGACEEALDWLRETPCTVDELCAHCPEWALWAYRLDGWIDVLGAARLDACAAVEPWCALTCAAALLSPERLDACAAVEPWCALEHAAALLTPERLAWCEAQQ